MIDPKNLKQEDREFSIIKDGIRRLFIYDPDMMNFAQIADANTKFAIHEAIIKNIPATMDHYMEAIKREAYVNGLSAILLEVDIETKQPINEDYKSHLHNGIDCLKAVKGLKEFQRLEACKLNFFTLQGVISIESIQQLTRTLQELEKEGIGKDLQGMILKAAVEGKFNSMKIEEENSIQPDMSNQNTEKV